MADLKYSTMPPATLPLAGSELTCLSQSGVSVSITVDNLADFIISNELIYGDGISFDDGTNTISADINTTNMQFTASQINTIQDIDITASPTFETMTLTSTTEGFLMPRMTTVAFDSIVLPENGLIAWSQSSNRFRVNKGFPGTPNYDELAYFNDIPQDTTAFGEMYFQGNAVETVISGIGAAAKVDAVYSTGDLLAFTAGSGILIYTGLQAKEFALSLSITTTLNLSTADISVIIYLNGSPVSKTEQGTFTGSTTPGFQSTSVSALIEMSTNDEIEVFVKNNTSLSNITVQDLNLSVSTVGGAIGNLADQVVVAWNNSISPVSVLPGFNMDITAGLISTIAEVNVVTSVEGSTSPVALSAGSGIDISAGVISAVGGPGGEDLQQAYNNGNGEIIQIISKPVLLGSDSKAIVPTLDFQMNDTPDFGGGVGKINFKYEDLGSTLISNSAIDVISTALSPNLSADRLRFFSGKNGVSEEYMSLNGDSNQVYFQKSIQALQFLTVGTGASIGGNCTVSQRMNIGPTSAGPVLKLASVLQPTETYPVGPAVVPVWQTIDGTNLIPANSFNIGDVIEIDCVGYAQYSQPDVAVVGPSVFNVTFGGLLNINSSNTNFTQSSSLFNSGFNFKLRFTRTGTTAMRVSGFGSIMNQNRTTASFLFPNVSTNLYNAASSYTIGVNWYKGIVISPPGFYNLICSGLTINQYT